MKFITVDTYDKMSRQAANIISAQVIIKPDCVLGLATGSSPLGTYRQLIEWYNKGDIDFSAVTTVNLDEYVGLDGNNPQSYRYFMDHNLFAQINIDRANTFVPNGCAADLAAEGQAYDARIEALGGIDLQLLGHARHPRKSLLRPDHARDPRLDPPTASRHHGHLQQNLRRGGRIDANRQEFSPSHLQSTAKLRIMETSTDSLHYDLQFAKENNLCLISCTIPRLLSSVLRAVCSLSRF